MRKYWIYFVLLSLTLTSCQEEIDFSLNDMEPAIVIDGVITSEKKHHRVKVTTTTSYYNDEPIPEVSGALVNISDGINDYILTEVSPGIYETDSIAGTPGRKYVLTVSYSGKIYTAECKMESVAPIFYAETVLTDTVDFLGTAKTNYYINMFAFEPAGKGDHYLWKYYVNDSLVSDTVKELIFNNDDFIDGSPIFFPVFEVDTATLKKNDKVTLEMWGITEDYYDYLFALLLANYRGTLFDGPPSNTPTNIDGGAYGYFFAADVTKYDTYVVE